jgi:hypothetical protein
MTPSWRTFLLSTATTVTVLGGGYTAYAGWAPAVDAGSLVLDTVLLPTGNVPQAVLDGNRVVLSWRASTGDDLPALTYVVTRHGPGTATEVCVVTATSCHDAGVPAGTWRYTVRPDLGSWHGREGPPGRPVTVPAGHAAVGADDAGRVTPVPAPPASPGAPDASPGTGAAEAIGDRPPPAGAQPDGEPGGIPATGPADADGPAVPPAQGPPAQDPAAPDPAAGDPAAEGRAPVVS